MLPKKIDVIYSAPRMSDHADISLSDADTGRTAVEVWRALKSLGFETEIVEIPADNLDKIKTVKCDLAFNLCEWTGTEIWKGVQLIEKMNEMKLPYTGAGADNYFFTTDKIASKKIMDKLHIATPSWQVFKSGNEKIKKLNFPIILKPVFEHGSVGISQDSVVTNELDLRKKVKDLVVKYSQPVLAEEFIAGQELKITIIGNGVTTEVLPAAEVLFGTGFENKWNILTFPSKWMETTEEFKGSNTVCPAPSLSATNMTEFNERMIDIYKKLKFQDYARYDIRLTKEGVAYLLEANSNPSLENEPRYAPILSSAMRGWTYEMLIGKIISVAWQRHLNAVSEPRPVKTSKVGRVFMNQLPV